MEEALWKELLGSKFGELSSWCTEPGSRTIWIGSVENNQEPLATDGK